MPGTADLDEPAPRDPGRHPKRLGRRAEFVLGPDEDHRVRPDQVQASGASRPREDRPPLPTYRSGVEEAGGVQKLQVHPEGRSQLWVPGGVRRPVQSPEGEVDGCGALRNLAEEGLEGGVPIRIDRGESRNEDESVHAFGVAEREFLRDERSHRVAAEMRPRDPEGVEEGAGVLRKEFDGEGPPVRPCLPHAAVVEDNHPEACGEGRDDPGIPVGHPSRVSRDQEQGCAAPVLLITDPDPVCGHVPDVDLRFVFLSHGCRLSGALGTYGFARVRGAIGYAQYGLLFIIGAAYPGSIRRYFGYQKNGINLQDALRCRKYKRSPTARMIGNNKFPGPFRHAEQRPGES